MTMTITRIPTTNTLHEARVSGIDPGLALSRRSIAAYRLPRRFDVHQVERVTAEISALGADALIDGHDVEMIDLRALACLEKLADAQAGLRFVEPSVALRATMAYTGHERLVARCTVSSIVAAAA
jgi:hypothetical protein